MLNKQRSIGYLLAVFFFSFLIVVTWLAWSPEIVTNFVNPPETGGMREFDVDAAIFSLVLTWGIRLFAGCIWARCLYVLLNAITSTNCRSQTKLADF